MAFPQPYVNFSGLLNQTGHDTACDMVFSRGILPSVARLKMLPEPQVGNACGTLTISLGQDRVQWMNCIAGPPYMKPRYLDEDPHTWVLPVYDRRIWWQFIATKGGCYNVRGKCGEIMEHTRASIKDLIEFLLKDMGEENYDISRVPYYAYPPVDWNHQPKAAHELARLCDMISMVVVLNHLTNRVEIHPLDTGRFLPEGVEVRRDPDLRMFGAHARPERVRVVGAPILFQTKFRLIPVGLDTDCAIRKLANLSYKPDDDDGGWSGQWYQSFPGVDPTDRKRSLAYETVWRWWRIDETCLHFNGVETPVDRIDQVLPLLPTLATGKEDDTLGSVIRCCEPWLEGEYWPQSDHPVNTCCERYNGNFEIDYEKGIVKLEYPYVKLDADGCPDLNTVMYLTIAHHIKRKDGTKILYDRWAPASPHGKGSKDYHHPELQLQWVQEYQECECKAMGHDTPNLKVVEAEAETYVQMAQERFLSRDATGTQDVSYDGIVPIALDGAVAQVSYRIGDKQPATTRASRLFEHAIFDRDYQERRRMWRTEHVLEEAGI